MREAGYYTAYKGKFHMGAAGAFDTPDDDATLQTNALEPYGFSDWNAIGEIAGAPLQGYHYDDYIEGEATRWLREKGAEVNAKGQSFFLVVNFVNPHDIMYSDVTDAGDGSQEDTARLELMRSPENAVYKRSYEGVALPAGLHDAVDGPTRVPAHAEYKRAWEKNAGSFAGTDEHWGRFRDFYLNCIQDNDDYVLALLREAADLGLLENTIILMTADHGEMEGDHDLRGKGNSVYERNIHVPLTVYHPEIKGGGRVGRVISHVDLAPTIIGLTCASAKKQAQLGEGLRGTSFAGELFEPSGQEGQALFAFEMLSMVDSNMGAERDESGKVVSVTLDRGKRGFMRGLITPQYKFARYFAPSGRNTPATLDELYGHNDVELYDLESDPETRPAISIFEAIGRMRNGAPAAICEFEPTCGHAGCVEADGSVYASDRLADERHLLGNLLHEDLAVLMERNRPFGTAKLTALAPECLSCEYLRLCFGGCPTKRFALASSGAPINVLCAAYRQLLSHMSTSAN